MLQCRVSFDRILICAWCSIRSGLVLLRFFVNGCVLSQWTIIFIIVTGQWARLNVCFTIKNFFDRAQSTTGLCRTLRMDVRTRWNSTLKMVDSYLALKETVCRFVDERKSLGLRSRQVQKLDHLELNSNEWSLMKILGQLLKPFDFATELLSAQYYPTIGLYLFVVHRNKLFFDDTDTDNELQRQVKKLLLNSTMHYIDNEEEQMRILQVTAIDHWKISQSSVPLLFF